MSYTTGPEGYWNTGNPWSEREVADLRYGAAHGTPIDGLAVFMMRTPDDLLEKARDLGLSLAPAEADASAAFTQTI